MKHVRSIIGRLALAGLVALPFAGISRTATAQPAPKASASTKDADAVRDLMRTGVAEYKKGNLQAAREAFLQAWAIKPHYAIAASLAEVEMALGQYRSTAEHLEYYLSNLPDELGDKRSAAEDQLAEARKHLAVLRITVDGADTTAYVDGVAVETGKPLLLDPGPHVLVAERGNVRSAPREVVFVAGQSADIQLEAKAPEPAPAATPAPKPAPPPPSPPVNSTSHAPEYILIGGGALTLVAVAVGAGFSLDSASARQDADRYAEQTKLSGNKELVPTDSQCTPANAPAACAALHDSLEESKRSHDVAIGAFIAAGVLAAGTVVTYVLWPSDNPRKDSAKVTVAPRIERGGFGTSVSVVF